MGFYGILGLIALFAVVGIAKAGRRRAVPIAMVAVAVVAFASIPDSVGLVLSAGLIMGALLLARSPRG